MAELVVVFHSGFGHAAAQTEAVRRGAESVAGIEARVVPANEVDGHRIFLDEPDALVMGSAIYMGSVSAGLNRFMDGTAERYIEQRWRDKLAAGFSNSASQSGDKS